MQKSIGSKLNHRLTLVNYLCASVVLSIREVPQPASSRVGASNIIESVTVLFVFGVSRLNRRCLLKPVFDLVLLGVHRQNLAFRKVITLRTFLYGLSFTALVIGRTSDQNLSSFLSLLDLVSILLLL